MSRVPWWGPVVGVVVLGSEAGAGTVRGQVTVPVGAAASVREVVVFVDSLPPKIARSRSRGSRPPRITQVGQRFEPRVLAIVAGTTVQFWNRDEVYHNVFSVSPAKHFDLGKYPPRAVNQVTFDRPGIVPVFCDIHSGEAGWIVVAPNLYFARPARDGAFELPWMPAGTYSLHLWHPTLGERTREVEVPHRGDIRVTIGF